MTKEEYKLLLRTKEWIQFSFKIKKRDGFKCAKCGSEKMIQSHHLRYINGRKPWEYDMSCLVTLCRECHLKEHGISEDDYDFYKKNKDKVKITNKDRELQKKRDRLLLEGKIHNKPFDKKEFRIPKKSKKMVKYKNVKHRKLTRKEQKIQEYREKLKREGKLV